jgi:hypothetical protein
MRPSAGSAMPLGRVAHGARQVAWGACQLKPTDETVVNLSTARRRTQRHLHMLLKTCALAVGTFRARAWPRRWYRDVCMITDDALANGPVQLSPEAIRAKRREVL